MYIYSIKNLLNNMQYIGCATHLNSRWRTHKSSLRNGKHDNWVLQKDWNEYGESKFEFLLIEEFDDIEESGHKEDSYIKILETKFPKGYNLTDGGKGISGFEQRQDQIDKRSIGMTGEKNIKYGKKIKTVENDEENYFGVYKYKKSNSKYIYFIAKITLNSKNIWIGSYKTQIEAAIAYDNYWWNNVSHDLNHLNFPENYIEGNNCD
jgi:group I intron endonuclease